MLLLDSGIMAPPAGAGPFSVTVAVEVFPPIKLAGLSANDESVGRVTVRTAVR